MNDKNTTRIVLALLGVVAVIIAVVVIISIAASVKKQQEHDMLVDTCLIYVGFHNPDYSPEEKIYLAMGCETWADNQQG